MKSIPLQFKKIAVGAYICSVMTGILIALVFAVTIIGSIPAIRYLLTLKPTEVLHGR